MYRVVSEAIDVAAVTSAVGHPGAGATVTFIGTTRDHNEGRRVARLEYEAYASMAVAEMQKLGEAAAQRWPVQKIAIVHRVGVVPIGEASVVIAVSSAHRTAAFEACRFLIDRLKEVVPIWKKEHFAGGAAWIGLTGSEGGRGEPSQP